MASGEGTLFISTVSLGSTITTLYSLSYLKLLPQLSL